MPDSRHIMIITVDGYMLITPFFAIIFDSRSLMPSLPADA